MARILEIGGLGERSTFLRSLKRGLVTQPVKVGRSNCWPEREIEIIQRARIAGASDEQVRTLVAELMKKRAMPAELAERERHEVAA